MDITAFSLAQRFIGTLELSGAAANNPLIQWWLSLCGLPLASQDETPWCSAFVNGIAWTLRLPRSKSAAARSWLAVGTPIDLSRSETGFDVVILSRGAAPQPGPDVLRAPGHVGFYGGSEYEKVIVLGGNQGNSVSLARFDKTSVLGVRRLI